MWILCLLLLLAAGCGPPDDREPGPAPAGNPVVIPRHRGPPSPREAEHVRGMNYDPRDLPLAWTAGGELIVGHDERYTLYDVVSGTCAGSGFYAVGGGGPARPLAVGEPACRALDGDGVAVEPGGRWAVYSERVLPNNSRLVRMDLATGRVDPLPTGCRIYLERPSVSRDGAWIAAVGICRDRQEEEYGVYLLRADGTGLRLVARYENPSAPAWSPDGRRLAVPHARFASTRTAVAVLDTRGRVERIISPGAAPAWSPDGKWLAYLAPAGGGRPRAPAIFLARADGSHPRRLFASRSRVSFTRGWGPIPEGLPGPPLVWSPDSRWIAFTRSFDRGTSVWRVEVSSGRVEQVTAHEPPS